MDLCYCFEIHAFSCCWVTSGVLEVFPTASHVIFPIPEHLVKVLFFQSAVPSLSDRLYKYKSLQKLVFFFIILIFYSFSHTYLSYNLKFSLLEYKYKFIWPCGIKSNTRNCKVTSQIGKIAKIKRIENLCLSYS